MKYGSVNLGIGKGRALHLARLSSEQEHSKKQTRELIRDLKRSQDRLLKVEQQKLELLQELNTLKASQHEMTSKASSNVQRHEARIQQLVDAEKTLQNQLGEANTQLDQLRESKEMLETQLPRDAGEDSFSFYPAFTGEAITRPPSGRLPIQSGRKPLGSLTA